MTEKKKLAIQATAEAFYEHLTSRELLSSITTRKLFEDELWHWKSEETKAGRNWKGGTASVIYSLSRALRLQQKNGKLKWRGIQKAPLEQVRELGERVLRELETVEKDKGRIKVEKLDLNGLTASRQEVLKRRIVIKNEGKQSRRLIQVGFTDAKRPGFQLTCSKQTPFDLGIGKSFTVDIKITMPNRCGSVKNLLVIKFDSFQIGRFVDITCGDPALIEKLRPSSKYKKKKRKRKKTSEPPIKPPKTRGTGNHYQRALPQYKVSPTWKQLVANHEAEEQFKLDLYPLNSQTYVERFSKLLWCEEYAQEECLDGYGMEGVTMRATSSRLELLVPGLSENRPSIIVGDCVDVTCSFGKFRGEVKSVEQKRVLLSFAENLHRQHTATTKYDVEFVYSRVPMRLAHQGLHCVQTISHILFPEAYEICDVDSSRFTLVNSRLNKKQTSAVQQVLSGRGCEAPFILFGPPGTGKTTTLVEMIAQVALQGRRVLAVAPTNAAADVICERLDNSGVNLPGSILRMMAYSRSRATVPESVLPYTTLSDDGSFPTPSQEKIEGSSVLIATLATAAKLYNHYSSIELFDCVFIDEAGQALEPECVAPIATLMKKDGQVVLAGDHMQLGPIVLSPFARSHGLGISLLERLSSLPAYQHNVDKHGATGYDPALITMLTDNYRSHPDIISVSNELFYHSMLNSVGDPQRTHALCKYPILPASGTPLIMHHVTGMNTQEASSPSWFNPSEAEEVLHHVKELLDLGVAAENIGVIAPYHKQVQKIKKALAHKGIEASIDGVKVGSTELFQGQERQVIIISTVRSNPSLFRFDFDHNLGFVANPKRFNVAVTRAEALLIIVGNASVLASDANWKRLLVYCQRKGAWKGDPVDLTSGSDSVNATSRDPGEDCNEIISLMSRLCLDEDSDLNLMSDLE